jgi:integrase
VVERQHLLGRLSKPTKLTLQDWVSEWLQQGEWRPSTRAAYERSLAAWCDELGGRKLHTLTPALLHGVLARWKRQGVGARTLQQRWQYFRACLAQAVRLDLLPSNPLDRIQRPHAVATAKVRWSTVDVRAFLAACRASPRAHADLLAFLLLSGARVSEALALTWRDIDVARGVIHVEKALVWVGNTWTIETPKSLAGRRTLHVPPDAVEIVQARPRALDPDERIFQTSTGAPPRKDNLSRLMKALCADADVARIRVHDLRHVHAALCVVGGLDVKALQQRLGHSRASVSLDIYSYAMAPQERSVQALQAALGE